MNVVVYEDFLPLRRSLQAILLRHNQSVAADFFEADVAFVDIHLGELDGNDVIRAIRRFRPNCYVVAMSGSFADLESPERLIAVTAGAHELLAKPFTPEEIGGALARAKAWQENHPRDE